MELPFRIETIGGRQVKIRDDGRRGLCVADEGLLWDMLQAALQRIEELTAQVEAAHAR
jgi:hypothetical protein